MMKLHQLLQDSAASLPDKAAVVDPERGFSVTYSELQDLAEVVRDKLSEAGVSAEDRVGVCMPKSIASLSGVFGILSADAAYVPVDSTAPPARNAFIFSDCAVRAIIISEKLAPDLQAEYREGALTSAGELECLSGYGEPVVLLVDNTPDSSTMSDDVDTSNLAYILYTSGSTGKPKGVMHSHASSLAFIDWCSEVFEPTSRDCFSSHAPFHFDLSILDVFVSLKHGAKLVLLGDTLGKQPAKLAEVIDSEQISVWYSTPSILRLLVEYGQEGRDYSALRLVFFAGEVFPVKHLRSVIEMWPNPRYFNLYGPTETNVCTYYEVARGFPAERTEPFPIGKDCSGDIGMVVDSDYREVSHGEEGELLVRGYSVMRGYWNLPERNAEAFYTGPAGECWYKTGDVVRVDSNGDYVYIGRRDRMVKRRGYRVELGEIEAALYSHEFVNEAAVVAKSDEESGTLIHAFLNWSGDKPPSMIAMKQFCSRRLPLYMIPDKFIALDSLPKTSTAKIDYQKLVALG